MFAGVVEAAQPSRGFDTFPLRTLMRKLSDFQTPATKIRAVSSSSTMKPHRRDFLHLAAAAAALPAAARVGYAEAYPARPVRLIVCFPGGTATDIVARVIAQALSERLGQQFAVDNRPGAAGNLGTELV